MNTGLQGRTQRKSKSTQRACLYDCFYPVFVILHVHTTDISKKAQHAFVLKICQCMKGFNVQTIPFVCKL